MTTRRTASAAIHPDALGHNLERIRDAAPGARVLAVVKADAYGHGMARSCMALGGTDAFAVACVEEAATLREASIDAPIVVLAGALSAAELDAAARLKLELVVHDAMQLDLLADHAGAGPSTVWLKIDTGMNRLGFRAEHARAAWERLRALPTVGDIRLMTHLARADEPEHPMTGEQARYFEAVTQGWPGERSLANSAAVFAHPGCHADWVRPGLALYGVSPFADRDGAALGLRPAMTFGSELISVREVRAGESVGYGAAWTAPAPARVGIVGVGYGDGYPRHAGPGTEVLVDGVRCPLVGRVSMDMLAVDLAPRPQARIGDSVVLWGEGLPVEEVARKAGTIPWTLLCGVTDRVRFTYT